MSKRIIILGGGIGGVVVANKLRKKLSKDHEIIVFDKEEYHLFSPSLLWVMMGWRKNEQIRKPLSLLEKKGIKFINDNVETINFENKSIVTSKENISYNYLVIALGASLYPENVEGFIDSAYNLYDLSSVEKLRDNIKNFDKRRVVILVSSTPYKCSAAPFEAGFLLAEYFKKKHQDVELDVIFPAKLPMGVAGPEVGKMIVTLLENKDIRFYPNHQVDSIDSIKNEIIFTEEKSISFDLLIGVPPHGVPSVLNNTPILGKGGWVKVDPYTLETDLENVYAIGDVTSIPLTIGKSLPKAGVFAHSQAEVVAKNIISKIKGREPHEKFDGKGNCFIELGDGKAGYASGNFYAQPKPEVVMKNPSRRRHWMKVLFEKWWLRRWF